MQSDAIKGGQSWTICDATGCRVVQSRQLCEVCNAGSCATATAAAGTCVRAMWVAVLPTLAGPLLHVERPWGQVSAKFLSRPPTSSVHLISAGNLAPDNPPQALRQSCLCCGRVPTSVPGWELLQRWNDEPSFRIPAGRLESR